ncbi:MAG TPA: N-acetylneuraminate synthase family protein [Spirochaetota bacterium]|nr:N-acetylneuraminate synthase family protein [Spirochaetota bacterium]
MKGELFNKLFIFEMANNHMGDVGHGLKIIRDIHAVASKYDFRFGFKLQYRNLDTFIHPDYKGRSEFKYVKRFSETRLSEDEFIALKNEMTRLGFVTICTPFDEESVDMIERHGFDIIKIASCSFTDWPLLERISKTDKPLIASTAGIALLDIDNVVSFFEHREKDFALMHCVGEYPTQARNLDLGQIELFRARYQNVPIGYSTHEDPENMDAVKMAVAAGAIILEKHVGVPTDAYQLNAYSASPGQVDHWLDSALRAFEMRGEAADRRSITEKERTDLRGLQRGVFVKNPVKAGEKITAGNLFFAIPNLDGQLVANDLSKYSEFVAKKDIPANGPVLFQDVDHRNLRDRVIEIIGKVVNMISASSICLPNKLDVELSHHFGIDRFDEWGATIINLINREYCKKIIILLPGQNHPAHLHKKKEETFHVVYGSLVLSLDGKEREYREGDIIIVERGMSHSFRSAGGAIFEEISTTHYVDDSFYDDANVMANKHRKTAMTYWSDWLTRPIR